MPTVESPSVHSAIRRAVRLQKFDLIEVRSYKSFNCVTSSMYKQNECFFSFNSLHCGGLHFSFAKLCIDEWSHSM